MDERQRVACPYCREMILADAAKCKECGSTLRKGACLGMNMVWARNVTERKFFGVAAAIARNFHISVTLVRLAFVLATLFHLLGLFVYLALVVLIPYEPGQRSWFEKVVDAMSAALDSFRSHPVSVPAERPAEPSAPAASAQQSEVANTNASNANE